MYCRNCGSELDSGVKFCPACGARVEDGGEYPEIREEEDLYDAPPEYWEEPFGQPEDYNDYYRPPRRRRRKKSALLSFLCFLAGILALLSGSKALTFLLALGGIILGIAALAKDAGKRWLAITGLVLAGLSFFAGLSSRGRTPRVPEPDPGAAAVAMVETTERSIPAEPIPEEPEEPASEEAQPTPEEAVTEETVPEGPQAPAAEEIDGVRPEIREVMESYEAFMDEYVSFMANYDASDTGSLLKYTEILGKYAKFAEKATKIEDMDLTDEEALYYADVSLRISQKLLKAVGSTSNQ